jgi:2-oxoglutarate ferredoxin oxidoreductase subunit alpha
MDMSSIAKPVETISQATVRFAGDSGDGMQLAGMRFTDTSAAFGNDIATLPDFPAEIRAPAGTVAGVSGFQVNFASTDIYTPGDKVDALIAMNPAAFKANVNDVRHGGVVIVDDTEFTKIGLKKAGYPDNYNPLDDEQFQQKYKVYRIPLTRLTQEELANSPLGAKETVRCKNMYALGLIYYLYDRPLTDTVKFLQDQFLNKKNLPDVADANIRALKAGFNFGVTAEIFPARYQVAPATIEPGVYRRITGNEGVAMGLVAAAQLSGKQLIYCSYPITPASDILHYLAAMRHFGVKTFQAEDEIAAMCAAIGVSYAGQLGATGTSGPGLALKAEAMNLAVITELPVVIVDVQRGGPSTGLPTKVEGSDLLQAIFGRNGDSPVIVLAPRSPSDCFDVALEAVRLAYELMSPVVLLSDGYIANGAEPWRVPDPSTLAPIPVKHATDPATFKPYARNEHGARPYAIPGTPGLQHRLGGLEKTHITGTVNYEGPNHQLMTLLRKRKLDLLAERLPTPAIEGPASGDLLIVGWGGTYGAITTAAVNARAKGQSVSAIHLRHLNPLPKGLASIFKNFKHVLVPELNTGQLRLLLRGKYLVDARGLNKIQGQPFLVEEITQAIDLMLSGAWGDRDYLTPNQQSVRMEDQDTYLSL